MDEQDCAMRDVNPDTVDYDCILNLLLTCGCSTPLIQPTPSSVVQFPYIMLAPVEFEMLCKMYEENVGRYSVYGSSLLRTIVTKLCLETDMPDKYIITSVNGMVNRETLCRLLQLKQEQLQLFYGLLAFIDLTLGRYQDCEKIVRSLCPNPLLIKSFAIKFNEWCGRNKIDIRKIGTIQKDKQRGELNVRCIISLRFQDVNRKIVSEWSKTSRDACDDAYQQAIEYLKSIGKYKPPK